MPGRFVARELDTHTPALTGFEQISAADALVERVQALRESIDGGAEDSASLPFGADVNPDWIHFLSPEQEDAFLGIVYAIDEALEEPRRAAAHFLVGGPGTGKTSVLLCLLDMPDDLTAFVRAQTTQDLTQAVEWFRSGERLDVILVDAPSSLEAVRFDALSARRHAGDGSAVVVVAFDPLQVEGGRKDELTDDSLEAIHEAAGAVVWPLRDGYRQRREVGTAAKGLTEAILPSSPLSRCTQESGVGR